MESSSLSIASVIEDPAKPNSILAEPEFCYINVSGQIFKTRNKTLNLFPNTLLGSNAKTVYFNKDTGCYDFQRDRQSFDSILYYYQSKGVLRKPPNVSEEIFHKEVMFYGIKSHRIANGMMQTTNPKVKGLKRILSQKPAEYMHYKKLLRIQMIDLFVTVLFVIAVISEQIIQGAQNYEVKDERLKALVYNWKEKSIPLKIIMAIETLCTLWITTFLIMRFYWSENRCKFAKSFMATMDVFVVASYFVSLVLFELETYLEKQKKSSDQDADSNIDQNKIFTIYRIMACLRMIKLFRMVHVFNLARYNALFFSLGMAVKESISDLAVIFMFIFFCIVGYATAMFWITFKFTDDLEVKDVTNLTETEKMDRKFDSIFSCMWWSLITITTVGYGDMIPTTTAGKVIGAMCACSGVPLIAIPLPIISQKFDVYYRRYCKRMEKRNTKKETARLGSKWMNYLDRPFFDQERFFNDIIKEAGPNWRDDPSD